LYGVLPPLAATAVSGVVLTAPQAARVRRFETPVMAVGLTGLPDEPSGWQRRIRQLMVGEHN
jgi:hypothetical protein